MQYTLRYICYFFGFFFFGVLNAQEINPKKPLKTIDKDSIVLSKEVLLVEKDSTQNDTIKKKSFLNGDVVYSASDYMRLNRRDNKMYLYDNAKIKYTDLDIKSGSIIVNQNKKEVYAKGIIDTTEIYNQTPVFTQGSNVVEPDTIRFNFDSKKALIYNSKTNQNEFNIINEVSKRENDSVVYMKNVKFTTSKNLEDPEYYFYARRIKFIPKKKIITGLVNMYIADVPTPLGLPFGYFPLTEDSVSGFIIPSFSDSEARGFTFQNGGYYFAISDYVNLTILGNYSTNSSFSLQGESSYAKRYKYSGNVNVRFENNLNGERGLPDFSKSTNYNIQWSHSQDSKSAPNSRFSASVNFGSSQFFRQSINPNNIGSQLTNVLSSNVSYSRTFPVKPRVDFQTAINIRQNSQTEQINFSIPTSVNLDRIFPFAPKVGTKKGFIQNINFRPSSTFRNQTNVDESDFLTQRMLDDAELGVVTTVPISTNFKLLKHISSTAGVNYSENWAFKTIRRRFDPEDERAENNIVTDTVRGFDSFRTYNFSSSLGTTIYGTVKFKETSKIKAIRHVVRPQIGYTYTPAFNEFYEDFVVPGDAALLEEDRIETFTRFQGNIVGQPGNRESSALSFSISNNLEAKIADRDTTKLEPKRIKIINSLNFSSGYNFRAERFKLQNVNFSGSIPINSKLTINFGGTLDPYALDSNNNRIEEFNINNGGSLFRLTNARTNFGYSFSSKDFERKNKNSDDLDESDIDNEVFRNGGRPDDLFGSNTENISGNLFPDKDDDNVDKTDIEFYHYKIPWNFRLSYSLNYNNVARRDEISSQSLQFSGDVEIAPRWKIGASSGYDFVNNGITFTNLRFQRDLESWTMSFNWVPIGPTTTWNFFIGISSSVLSDIKWDKRSEPDRRL